MKKHVKTILGATLAFAALPLSILCIGHSAKNQNDLEENPFDPISTLAISAPLKTDPSPVIKVSETYVQPGQYNKSDTDYICLRFSTAVYLGSDSGITSISYRRTYGSETSEWKDVTTVYRGIKISNDVTNYYDPDNGLVTTDPHNDYYFACYTISIKPTSVAAYSNVDFEMEIAINGTEDENIAFTSKCSYDTAMLPAANRHVLKTFDLDNNYIRKDVVAKKNTWTALNVDNVTDSSLKEVVYTSGNKVRRLDQTYYETDPTKWNSGACNGYNDANATSGRGGNYTDKALAPLFATVDSKQAVYMSALHIDDPLQYNSKNGGKNYGFSEIRFAHTLASAKKVKFEYKYWDVNADISADDGGTSHAVCQFHDGSAYPTENMNLINDNQWHTYEATYTKADSINLTHFVLKIYHMAGEMFIRNLVYFDAEGKCDHHVGYHYAANSPQEFTIGNVEFWKCSQCDYVSITEPAGGSWTDSTIDPSKDNIPDVAKVEAPWVDCGHAGISYLEPCGGNNDHSDDTYEHTSEAATFVGTYDGGLQYCVQNDESINRNIFELTMKGTGWKWNAYPAFSIKVYDSSNATIYSKAYHTADTSILGVTMTIFKEDGTQVFGYADTNVTDYFVYRFDLRNVISSGKSIKAISLIPYNNDAGNPKVTTSIKRIVFKSTLCGHALSDYEQYTYDYAKNYQAKGTFVKCSKCGEILSSNITRQAPWLSLAPNSSSNGFVKVDDGYSITGKGKALYFDIPANKEGRTQLAITVQTSAASWEAFYMSANGDEDFYVGSKSHYQFFTPNNGFNFDQAPFFTYVLKDGMCLPYDTSNYTISNKATYFPTGTEKVTYIADLTSTYCDEVTRIKLDGVAASTTTVFSVDLREPEAYSNTRTMSWDNWKPTMITKTSSTQFTIQSTASESDVATVGHINDSTYASTNKDDSRPVARMKVKMVKNLDTPDTAGNMQWYVKFNDETLNFTNASNTFAQKPNIHVTDINGNLVKDGTLIPNNTWYYIEFNFSAAGANIQFQPEGATSWGAGYLLVEEFNVRMSLNASSFGLQ